MACCVYHDFRSYYTDADKCIMLINTIMLATATIVIVLIISWPLQCMDNHSYKIA